MTSSIRRFIAFLSLMALAVFIPSSLIAHPHMSFSTRFAFVWEGSTLSGVNMEWTFDKFFSADIINAYDSDRSGTFSTSESKNVYEKAFIYTKNYYFFTFIRVGDKRFNPAGVKNFTAGISDGSLVYRFFVDLSAYATNELYLAVYDYTFFCDIPYQKTDTVTFLHDPALGSPSYSLVENKDFPIYYNPLGAADDNTVYYQWKKGLVTFYPREIHLQYEKK